MNRNVQEILKIWERKIIRRILLGRKTENGYVWRTNEEVYSIDKGPAIDMVVRARR